MKDSIYGAPVLVTESLDIIRGVKNYNEKENWYSKVVNGIEQRINGGFMVYVPKYAVALLARSNRSSGANCGLSRKSYWGCMAAFPVSQQGFVKMFSPNIGPAKVVGRAGVPPTQRQTNVCHHENGGLPER